VIDFFVVIVGLFVVLPLTIAIGSFLFEMILQRLQK